MFATNFESEEQSFRNRKNSTAVIVTVAFHALLLLFLLWMVLTPPNPPYTENGGVSVNFGTDATGSGDVQPMTLTPIQANFTSAPSAPSHTHASNQEDIATQDLEDAPVMESGKTKKPILKPDVKPLEKPSKNIHSKTESRNQKPEVASPPEPKADPNALFKKGAYGNPNNSKGDGVSGGQGDQGKLEGDPNSKNYLTGDAGNGKGPGSGGISLRGRKVVARPNTRSCNEKGVVIIDIAVDRSGKVVHAEIHRAGSTLIGGCSVENAIKSALAYKFNSDPHADELQYGSITYVFTIQ